jgi:hypothetical protein
VNLIEVLDQLKAERAQLDAAIAALEPLVGGGRPVMKPAKNPVKTPAPAAGGELKCEECGRTFKRATGLGSHRRLHKKPKPNGHAKPAKATPARPRAVDLDEDDQDDDDDKLDDRQEQKPVAAPPAVIRVACDECGEKFPDARAMGIHKSRCHFGSSSLRRLAADGA